jgi:hypothetical protein
MFQPTVFFFLLDFPFLVFGALSVAPKLPFTAIPAVGFRIHMAHLLCWEIKKPSVRTESRDSFLLMWQKLDGILGYGFP